MSVERTTTPIAPRRRHMVEADDGCPTGDSRPVGETDYHRNNLVYTLQRYFANDPMTYFTGNMFLYHVPGDRW
jgi:hypothetical protein